MKKITSFFLLLLTISVCNSQNQGSITSKQLKPKAGVVNHYTYQPAKNLLITGKIEALAVYQDKQEYFSKTIRLTKTGTDFQFSFKAPDSVTVLIFSIVESGRIIPDKNSFFRDKKIVIDNNNEHGYIMYLHNRAGKRSAYEQLDLAGLIDYTAYYGLGLKEKPDEFFIKMFEDSYKLHPGFKDHYTYLDYLFLKYKENEEAIRPELLEYASRLLAIKNDEKKWGDAVRIYSRLKMVDERNALKEKILTVFPNGNLAKENYWSSYKPDTTEASMLASMNAYLTRFNDNTAKARDRFYVSFIFTSINYKDWSTAFKYGELVSEKMQPAYTYDYNAWKLSGKQTDNPGTDLENAKMLSARSIAVSIKLMNNPVDMDEGALTDLKDAHYKFYDTYALILYKLGQYDSAFYYQDLVSRQGKELNTGGMERYAAYAEKVKGASFTRQFLESKLLAGTKSAVMLKQLQSIYKKLNLPEDEFNRLQERSLLLVKQKNEAAIMARYGTLKAPGFSLKNMAGETVTLSDLKNKVVILDFWATWCSPCKASFPAMQELVTKYKDNQDIVFLFIDTWENDTQQKKLEEVTRYMQDNKYSFNVLFDVKNTVVKDYKAQGIPKKIVIDKNGNMIFTDELTGIVLSADELINEMDLIIGSVKK